MSMPQIIMIVLFTINLTESLINHGKATPRNFWAAVIGAIIEIAILKWGGFF